MALENEILVHKLNERVKELNCLYEISKICQNLEGDFSFVLKQIINIIPMGWQFPEELKVNIHLDGEIFGEFFANENVRKINSDLIIKNTIRGFIAVAYSIDSTNCFLEEEIPLLNKIGIETSNFIERFEQKQTEKLLAEKMKQNDRLHVLGELTAGIAHELNTPLGNILGYAELLKKIEKQPLKKTDLQKIIISAKNAREIVKKLMYFSCDMPQHFNLIDLNEHIRENLGLLDNQILKKEINLSLNLDNELPKLKIDSLQFTQVLFNLVLNAIHSMENNGELTISTSVKDMFVQVSIKDNGHGIPDDIKDKIFQPFFSTKNEEQGTGLGLSVVHGIIKSHKGNISFISNKGEGTEFLIQLPLTL
jgi:two-component system NtrC family sensor kinase